MSAIPGASSCIYCEFVCLLFSQTHRETHRFFPTSGVQVTETNLFHYRRVTFSSQIKSKVDNILTKTVPLRINLNIDDTYNF